MTNYIVPGPVSSLQNVPAAQYTMKIESFSLLRVMKKEKHVSGSFEACGYKWRLILYPNGRRDRGVTDHISLYLKMAEPRPWPTMTFFKMLVYDYRQQTFSAVPDASGTACRFDHIKSEGGYDRLLALETFTTSSRFLDDDDSCVLGVELHVAMDTRKGARLSVIKGPKDNTHTWLVPNFSHMDNDKENWSPEYKIGDHPWWLRLYVNGYGKSKGKSISLYLYLGKGAAISEGGKLYAEYKLRMKNHSGDRNKHWVKEDQHSFSPGTYSDGFEDFVALDKLERQGLIKDDCLEIKVEITFMAIVRDF
ncbi:hypothetical protein RJ639_040609 [Escallonia herrerae]|uniref:MATH domain-containing protein n=1 Tax=Escallonia herrerae TaxID=1293975 RepID=A0AA89BCG4_9ASTE|nr:hypothetical protein RJ639_040609 [Escallonia herrerae]